MSSREEQFRARCAADTSLMATLLGGCYKSENTGQEGVNPDTTGAAFDATTGYLKPCAMIHQRGRIPDGRIVDPVTQVTSTSQIVEIYVYAVFGNGYTAIDAALTRLYVLWQGYQLSDSYPIECVNLLDRLRDRGNTKGAEMAKIDFQVRSIWRP